MATPKYCNITTDLQDAYSPIEEYANKRFPLKSFNLHSGYVYKTYNPGYVSGVFEDGMKLTSVSSVASINGVSKYYYDSTNDILYARVSDNNDPDTHEMEKSFDWVTLKTRMRDNAQDEIDGMLDKQFPRPIPESRQYHTSNRYDFGLIKATALLTCANILNAFGEFTIASELRKQITNAEDKSGIIDEYNSGIRLFSWAISQDELGKYNIEPDGSNTSAGFIELYGKYGGSPNDIDDPIVDWELEDETWLIQIDGGGVTGLGTFKWSRDNGTTWESTLKTTSHEWIYLNSGISLRFWDRNSAWVTNDKWRCYMFVERREDAILPSITVLRG